MKKYFLDENIFIAQKENLKITVLLKLKKVYHVTINIIERELENNFTLKIKKTNIGYHVAVIYNL